MIDTRATSPLPRSVSVSLNGIDQSTQDWMRQCQPMLQFRKTRSDDITVACYGDDYHRALAADYDYNNKHNIRNLLCLLQACPDSFIHLLQLHVRHVIFPGMPFDTEAFRLAVQTVPPIAKEHVPPFFSVSHAPPSIQYLPVKTSSDLHMAVSTTKEFFYEHEHSVSQADNASLAVKEALTNAIYHGFRQIDSHERKYDPETFDVLDDKDCVAVTIGSDSNWIIIRIADNAGALGPLRFANSLDRQISQRGLLDSRGRGFHLMHNLADRMVVTLKRGEATSIELYFLKTPSNKSSIIKHFELFEL